MGDRVEDPELTDAEIVTAISLAADRSIGEDEIRDLLARFGRALQAERTANGALGRVLKSATNRLVDDGKSRKAIFASAEKVLTSFASQVAIIAESFRISADVAGYVENLTKEKPGPWGAHPRCSHCKGTGWAGGEGHQINCVCTDKKLHHLAVLANDPTCGWCADEPDSCACTSIPKEGP